MTQPFFSVTAVMRLEHLCAKVLQHYLKGSLGKPQRFKISHLFLLLFR